MNNSWQSVHGMVDGAALDAATLNVPLVELRSRTDYLKQRLDVLAGVDALQSVRLPDVQLSTGADAPVVGDVVYINPATRTYGKAKASVDFREYVYQAGQSEAHAVGMLIDKDSTRPFGTIVCAGKFELGAITPWRLSDILQTGETFRVGPYYLSADEAGKLTSRPKGPAIYIGYFVDDTNTPGYGGTGVMSIQYRDVGSSHLHRPYRLAPQPAGTQEHVDGNGNIVSLADSVAHAVRGFEPLAYYDAYHGTYDGTDGSPVTETSVTLGGAWSLDGLKGLTITNVTTGVSAVITGNSSSVVTTATPLTWTTGNQYKLQCRTRLVVTGNYTATAATTYEFYLTDGSTSCGVPAIGSGQDYDMYITWTSSDPVENQANWDANHMNIVRIPAYETPVTIGNKGVIISLENALENAADPMWGIPEYAASAGTFSCSNKEPRRYWSIEMPSQTAGWVAKRTRQSMAAEHTLPTLPLTYTLCNGPFTGNAIDKVRLAAGYIHKWAYATDTSPSDGDSITIGSTVLEFDNNGVVTAGAIPVAIVTGTADPAHNIEGGGTISMRNLVAAINANVAGVTAVIDNTNLCVLLVTNTAVVVSGTLANYTYVTAGYTGTADYGSSSAMLVVHDVNYNVLTGANSIWSTVGIWGSYKLTNGLQVMLSPFDSTGGYSMYQPDPIGNPTNWAPQPLLAGQAWSVELNDTATGAEFAYNIGHQPELMQFYPAYPLDATALVVNGIEMSSGALFTDTPDYIPTATGLYWYSKVKSNVPWPTDWDNELHTFSAQYITHVALWLTRMKIAAEVVTSLRPAKDAPIKITRAGTSADGKSGDLEIDFEMQVVDQDASLSGYRVFKGVTGNKLVRGPVVSRILPGPGISVTSPRGVAAGYGDVTLGLSTLGGYSGLFETLALRNAKQDMIGMFPYIKLLRWTYGSSTNVNSGLTARFQVPYTVTGYYQVLVYMTLFGTVDIPHTAAAVKVAGLTMNYNVLRDYLPAADQNSSFLDNLIHPATARTVNVTLGKVTSDPLALIYRAYDPMVVHNNPADASMEYGRIMRALGTPFPRIQTLSGDDSTDPSDLKGSTTATALTDIAVTGGSNVAIEIQRAGVASGEYAGELGILELRWQLVPLV